MKPFVFKQCVNIIRATGKKARNLRELRDFIASVSDESVYHHMYQYFLTGRMLEYTNDFAHWAGESLEKRALAERLSNIDPYDFKTVSDLRRGLLEAVDDYLTKFPEAGDATAEEPFYFNETITLIFSVGIRARNLAEFLVGVRHIDAASIYYHFFDARARLGEGMDDFSRWLEESLEKKDLAAQIRAIDPFMHDIGGIREHIVNALDAEVKKEMEAIAGD